MLDTEKKTFKLRSVINAIKMILGVGDQDKEKRQRLESVHVTDCALQGAS